MRGRVSFAVIAGFISMFLFLGPAGLKSGWAEEAAKKPSKAEERRKALEEAERQAKIQNFSEQIMEKLDKDQWQIYLRLQNPPKDKKTKTLQNDLLTFSKGTVLSKFLSESGFSNSNFTLTVREDGVAVWETMQRDSSDNLAFWRGELNVNGEVMYGVLGRHSSKGERQDYTFTTTKPADFVEVEQIQPPKKEVAAEKPAATVEAKPAKSPKS